MPFPFYEAGTESQKLFNLPRATQVTRLVVNSLTKLGYQYSGANNSSLGCPFCAQWKSPSFKQISEIILWNIQCGHTQWEHLQESIPAAHLSPLQLPRDLHFPAVLQVGPTGHLFSRDAFPSTSRGSGHRQEMNAQETGSRGHTSPTPSLVGWPWLLGTLKTLH